MDFGFTNDLSILEANRAFRDAAVADGWQIEPTYGSESADRHATLRKDGWVMHAMCREGTRGKWKAETEITIWSPDGVQVHVPQEYDLDIITAGERTCLECGKTDVDTSRVGFAGRACEECMPAAKKKYEYPGWTN